MSLARTDDGPAMTETRKKATMMKSSCATRFLGLWLGMWVVTGCGGGSDNPSFVPDGSANGRQHDSAPLPDASAAQDRFADEGPRADGQVVVTLDGAGETGDSLGLGRDAAPSDGPAPATDAVTSSDAGADDLRDGRADLGGRPGPDGSADLSVGRDASTPNDGVDAPGPSGPDSGASSGCSLCLAAACSESRKCSSSSLCASYRDCAGACADCDCVYACQAGVDSGYVSTAELAATCEAAARVRTCAAACGAELPGTEPPAGCGVARPDAGTGKDALPPSQAPTPGTYAGGGVELSVDAAGTSVTIRLDYTKQCSTHVLASCTTALDSDHRFACSDADWRVTGYFDTTLSAAMTIEWRFTDYCQGVLAHFSGMQSSKRLHLVSDPCAPGNVALSASAARISTGKVVVIEATVDPVLGTCSKGVSSGTPVDWSLQGPNASGSSLVVAQSTTSAGKATGGVQAGGSPGWVTVRGSVLQTADFTQSADLSILVSRPCDPTTPVVTSTGMSLGKGGSLPVTLSVSPFDAANCAAGVPDGTSVTFTLVDSTHELTLSAASTTTLGGLATVTVVAPATTPLTECYEATLNIEVHGPAGDVYTVSRTVLYEPNGSCVWG